VFRRDVTAFNTEMGGDCWTKNYTNMTGAASGNQSFHGTREASINSELEDKDIEELFFKRKISRPHSTVSLDVAQRNNHRKSESPSQRQNSSRLNPQYNESVDFEDLKF
jgi:hypothetical protein